MHAVFYMKPKMISTVVMKTDGESVEFTYGSQAIIIVVVNTAGNANF